MTEARELTVHIVELLKPFDHCQSRRLFSGFGIIHRSPMFGLIADGTIHPRAGARFRECFAAGGPDAFGYRWRNREYRLDCFLAPEDFFDSESACLEKGRPAFDAAQRSTPRRKKRKS